MREIKFRAWDKTKQIMRFWPCSDNLTYWKDGRLVYFDGFGGRLILSLSDSMQYTGLKDKNKEAYKSDIIKGIHKTTKEVIIGEVVWDDGAFQWGVQLDSWIMNFECLVSCYDYEIIGNIHQNSELLEK